MYRVEVNTYGDGPDDWTGNGKTFQTWHGARNYARDLFMRWTAVRQWRIVDEQGKEVPEYEGN
jgi:hypothetical protein